MGSVVFFILFSQSFFTSTTPLTMHARKIAGIYAPKVGGDARYMRVFFKYMGELFFYK
tara:strand:- start:278 stop:451 length:174 start_codon:yes stop_codon:yes gene_type:complete